MSAKRVAYMVSRFPHPSETFILRELDEVDADDGLEISLMALFSPVDYVVHPAARRWIPKVLRPSAATGLGALALWLVRRPLRTLGTIASVIGGTARRPSTLVRSLATVPLAAAHARTIQREEIQHVHAHYATYPALAAWVASRLAGVPYSFTVHAHDIYVDQSMLRTKVEAAEFVVAISRFNQEFLGDYGGGERGAQRNAKGGVRPTPVVVIHCGIHPDVYPFEPRDAPAEGPIRAACVASLQEYKGHRFLVEALALPGLERLHVTCAGDGPLREELQALAEERGVADRFRLAGGLEEGEVADLLDRSAVFVLPSIVASDGQMEGLPVAIMEALASGLTAVSTRLSGIPEILIDGETGLLAEPGDPESLAAALRKALEPGGVDHRAGRELVEAEFDVTRNAAELATLLKAGGAG